MQSKIVKEIRIPGYEVLANIRNEYVLAMSENKQAVQPYVVWTLDAEGGPHTGSYFYEKQPAEMELAGRAFDWFDDVLELKEQEHPQQDEQISYTYQGLLDDISRYGSTKEQVTEAIKEFRQEQGKPETLPTNLTVNKGRDFKLLRKYVTRKGIIIKGNYYFTPELIPYTGTVVEVTSKGHVYIHGKHICALPL